MKRFLRPGAISMALTLVLIVPGPKSFAEVSRSGSQNRTLTFAERVAYQRAIEEVYWRHRIWPKENPGLKPLLDEVMPQGEIEKKVAGYLTKSLLAGQRRR